MRSLASAPEELIFKFYFIFIILTLANVASGATLDNASLESSLSCNKLKVTPSHLEGGAKSLPFLLFPTYLEFI